MKRIIPCLLSGLLVVCIGASIVSAQTLINRQLSEAYESIGGDVIRYQVSPDGMWYVYESDQDTRDVQELYSVPVDGSTSPVKLNEPISGSDDIEEFIISPDSSTVVFIAGDEEGDDSSGRNLFSAPIDGSSAAVQLNITGDDVQDGVFITPDSQRVIYGTVDFDYYSDYYYDGQPEEGDKAEEEENAAESSGAESRGYFENPAMSLFTVPIGGGSNTAIVQVSSTQFISDTTLSPDGSTLAYRLNTTDNSSIFDLYVADSTGATPPLNLTNLQIGEVIQGGIQFTPDNSTVLYRLGDDEIGQLFSAVRDGSTSPVQISPGLNDFFVEEEYFITSDSSQVVFVQEDSYYTGNDFITVASVDGSTTPVDLTMDTSFTSYNQVELTSDDTWVIFAGDYNNDDQSELFAVPADGSMAPQRLSDNLVSGGDIDEFLLSPDQSQIVYRADVFVDDQNDLFVVPVPSIVRSSGLRGDPVTQLNTAFTDPESQVSEYAISPDNGTVVFIADPNTVGTFELFSVSITGGSNTLLSPAAVEGGRVEPFSNEPFDSPLLFGGSQVGFIGSLNAVNVDELFSVPFTGGTAVRLNNDLALGGFLEEDYIITNNSLNVVYVQSQRDSSIDEVFVIPVDGETSPTRLSLPDAAVNTNVNDLLVTSDSTRAIFETTIGGNQRRPRLRGYPGYAPADTTLYRADLGTSNLIELASSDDQFNAFNGVELSPDDQFVLFLSNISTTVGQELFKVPVNGGSVIKVSDNLTTDGSINNFEVASDSSRVVYIADQEFDNVRQLFSVPLGSSSRNGALSTLLTPGVTDSEDVNDFEITPDGTTVVYEADQDIQGRDELYSVPIDGGTTPTKLNPDFASFADIQDLEIDPSSSWVVYLADQETASQEELYTVRVDGSTTAVKLNPPLFNSSSADVRSNYEITPDGTRVVFEGEFESLNIEDLYVTSIDGSTTPVLLTDPATDGVINRFEISPDSSVVAYVFGNEASPFRSDTRGYYFMATNLFIVDINDGTVLAQHDTNNFLSNLRFSPDSQSLIYIEETEDSARIFRLPVTGGTPVEINGPSAGGFLVDVDEANYTPDGNFVIYVGEQTVEGNDHLYSTEFFFAPSGFAAY